MRPVDRGSHPTNSREEKVVYRQYSEARGELIERLGEYCSYCEMHLDAALAVEHVQPKSKDSSREKDWTNFLLACPNCNSTKKDRDIVLGDYVWPDSDNTAACLQYGPWALVRPANGLSAELLERVQRTIELVGLDVNPDEAAQRKKLIAEGRDPASDRRWKNRHEKWGIACDALNDLIETISDHGTDSKDATKARRRQVSEAAGHGYWSVWMTVFKDDIPMRRLLIDQFKAAQSCFDANTQPIAR